MNVSHSIKIGSQTFQSTQSRLTDLLCNISLKVPVNMCRFGLALPEDLDIQLENEVEVQVGYDNDLKTIFSGVVTNVTWEVDKVTVEASSRFRQLVARRVNAYFDQPTANNIVKDLAGETEVKMGVVEPGLKFSFYAVGDGQSIYQHLKQLATQCGVFFYANEKDELTFGRALPGVPEMFQFGVNILSLFVEEVQGELEGVEVFGASPASFGSGPDAASWFTKQEVKGSGGSSGKIQRIYDPTARSQENAGQMAEAIWNKIAPKKKGQLKVLGNPKLQIGNTILISQMPSSTQNGTYQIIGITHKIKPRQGFVTIVEIEE